MSTAPNYSETTVTGQTWQRCHQVVIENPRTGQPVVRFEEERVLSLTGGAELRTPAPGLSLPFDPSKTIAMRDPATGEVTGQVVTYGEAYALLYSAYLDAAIERDTASLPTQPDQPATEESTGA